MTNKQAKSKKDIYGVNVRRLAVLLLVYVIASSALIAYITVQNSNLTKDVQDLKKGAPLTTWSIGDTVDTADFTFTLHDVKTNTTGIQGYLPVPEDKKFIVVDVTLKNKTADEQTFIPLTTAYIRDSQGKKYELTTAPDIQFTAAGKVASGDTIRGEIGFLIPRSEKSAKFYIEPFAARSPMVVIDLSAKL